MATLGDTSVVEYTQDSVEIDNLARFAVQEHNIKENAIVEFVRVLSAKKQVVSGTLYTINLEATDGGSKKVYETKVLEKLWLNLREVQEFKLVVDTTDVPYVSST